MTTTASGTGYQPNLFEQVLFELCLARGGAVRQVLEGMFQIQVPNRPSRLISRSGSCLDSHFGSVICNDKTLSHQLLQQLGIPTPLTIVTKKPLEAPIEDLESLGWPDVPLVVKPATTEQCRGVMRVEPRDTTSLDEAINMGLKLSHSVLISPWIRGNNYRCTWLANRLWFTTLREGSPDEVTSYHQGSRLLPVDPAPQWTGSLQPILSTVAMHCIGIDVIVQDGRPYVLELNARPVLLAHRAAEFLESLWI